MGRRGGGLTPITVHWAQKKVSHCICPVASAGGGDDPGGGRGRYTGDQPRPFSATTQAAIQPHSHTQTGSSGGSWEGRGEGGGGGRA